MRIEEEINKIVSDGWKIRRIGDGFICFERDFSENTVVCFLLSGSTGAKHGFCFYEKAYDKEEESNKELYDFFTNIGDRK